MSEPTAKEYGNGLVQGYVGWFWTQSELIERRFLRSFWIGLVLGVSATIVAAFPKSISEKIFDGAHDLVGWMVVVLSALATFFNATLVPRYKTLLEMREKGRIRMDALKQRFEVSDFEEKDRLTLEQIIAEIAVVENDFGGVGRAEGDGK